MSTLHMSQRTRIHHEISSGQRLANEAKRAREVAITLPDGKKRGALFEKARLVDLAARMLGPPELRVKSCSSGRAALSKGRGDNLSARLAAPVQFAPHRGRFVIQRRSRSAKSADDALAS
jgi:hypothetical protein